MGECEADALEMMVEINRLTERNAELEAECERLRQDNVLLDDSRKSYKERAEIQGQRADTLQAQLDAAKNIADEMNCEEWCCTSVTKGTPDRCDVCRIQQALNAHETA